MLAVDSKIGKQQAKTGSAAWRKDEFEDISFDGRCEQMRIGDKKRHIAFNNKRDDDQNPSQTKVQMQPFVYDAIQVLANRFHV
jgi:hypothetical protein